MIPIAFNPSCSETTRYPKNDTYERTFCNVIGKQKHTSSDIMVLGDIKTSIQATDHTGWVKLDGRLKTTLSAKHQTKATILGFGTNIPDATNSVLMQNGQPLGLTTGSNSVSISTSHLPNVTLTGTTQPDGTHNHPGSTISNAGGHDHSGATNTEGAHAHTTRGANGYDDRNFSNLNEFCMGDVGYSTDLSTTTEGAHTHTLNTNFQPDHTHSVSVSNSSSHTHSFTTSSINGNVTQITLDTTPQAISVNTFVFLG